jgi:hypothetical protein
MRPNTCIIHGSYLTVNIIEDYKTKMELGSIWKFSPGITGNILRVENIGYFNEF